MTRAGIETTLARVVKLVEEAQEKRAPVERLADRYARYFLPALLLAAGLTFYFTRDWLRTVAVLIVACPCALILATPTAMVAAIGGLARRGILVRGGTVLQHAAKIDTVVFDKTGTITEGRFEIVSVIAAGSRRERTAGAGGRRRERSDHVLARVDRRRGRAARGRCAAIRRRAGASRARRRMHCSSGRTIRAGNAAFLAEHGVRDTAVICSTKPTASARPRCWWPMDDRLAGAILLRDRMREGVARSRRRARARSTSRTR